MEVQAEWRLRRERGHLCADNSALITEQGGCALLGARGSKWQACRCMPVTQAGQRGWSGIPNPISLPIQY